MRDHPGGWCLHFYLVAMAWSRVGKHLLAGGKPDSCDLQPVDDTEALRVCLLFENTSIIRVLDTPLRARSSPYRTDLLSCQ